MIIEDDFGTGTGTAHDAAAFDMAPQLLSSLAVRAPSMPVELLPEVLRPWIADVCQRMRVPSELVAVPVIIACGALVGRRLTIRPKRLDDWVVVSNMWGGVVCRSGFLKSPAMAEALRPLRRLEAEKHAEFMRALAGRETAHRALELEVQALEAQIKSAHKKGADAELLVAALSEKRQGLAAASVSAEPRISTSDATVEKLGEILLQNPQGLLLVRDELVGWLRSFDKPGREGDRQFYLESWNGNGSYTVDRIGRGTLRIPALCLSIVGSMQPGPLRAYTREACSDGAGADGLLQRLQILVYPDDFPEWQNVDRWPGTEAKSRAYEAIRRIASDELATVADRVDTTDQSALPFLRFDAAAQTVFDTWRNELELRLRSDEFASNPALESHLAKYRSLMPSLALLFHLLDGAALGTIAPAVSETAARRAADWCEFLEAHAHKVYSEGGEIAAARTLAERIEKGDVCDGNTIRDVYRHGWRGLGTEDHAASAARILERIGWLKLTPQRKPGPGRDPSPKIALHPALKGGR